MRPLAAVLLLSLALPASALELSLEENKGDRGTIGFVDLQRLFREYPETQRAKEQFEGEVQARRLEVKRRKAELDDLKAELAALAVEREKLLKESLTEPAVLPQTPAPGTPQSPVPAPPESAVQASTAPAPAPAEAPASTAPVMLPGLPGMGPAPAPQAAPAVSATEAAPAPAETAPPLTAAQRVRAVEEKIEQRRRELDERTAAFKDYQGKAEQDLLELEKRRVQILLGRIYDTVQEVAKEEGVSIVVDKSAILFGQKAVDLTDKLIERLK